MSRRNSPIRREGLGELLGASAELAQAPQATQFLPVSSLKAGKGQPRREFNTETLQALADSIAQQGVLQPLLVRPIAGGHEIVAGERRWRAAQLAGLQEVPVVVRELSDQEAQRLALIENLQRENLNMVDEVDAKLALVAHTLGLSNQSARMRLMQLLREAEGPDHQKLTDLFATLGETWSTFAKSKLRILNWPVTILEAVRSGLPYTVAGIIVSAPEKAHAKLLEMAMAGASRETLKVEVQKLKAPPKPHNPQLVQVGKLLSDSRWVSSLSPQEQDEIERWLKKLPKAIEIALKRS